MTLPGNISTHRVSSLNGLGAMRGIQGIAALVDANGHYVNPLAWRSGIHGLGAGLTPGLHGCSDAGSMTGNAVYDCTCALHPAQQDQALVSSFAELAGGMGGLGDVATTDWSFTGSALSTLAPSLVSSLGFAVPNYVLYGVGLLLLSKMAAKY